MREKLCPPPRARCGEGKNRYCGAGRWDLGRISFIGRNPASLPIHPSFHNKFKKKSSPEPWGLPGRAKPPRGLLLLRAPFTVPFPPHREAAPARRGPSPPPLPRPPEGKHKGGGTGAGPGGPGGRPQAAPRTPRCSTIVPSQVPRSRLQLGFARRSHDVIRKSNHVF